MQKNEIRNKLIIDSLNEEIKQNRKRWKEHVDRMNDNRLCPKVIKYRLLEKAAEVVQEKYEFHKWLTCL